MALVDLIAAAVERIAAEFNTLRSEIVGSWSTAAELLDGAADRVVAVDALHEAIGHIVGPSHGSTVTLDGTAGMNVRLATVTSNFVLAFSTDIPDGWSMDIRVATSGGPYTMQFPTGSVLLGEAWTGTRQISLAASSVYLVTVKRAQDGSGAGYYLVSYVKEGG